MGEDGGSIGGKPTINAATDTCPSTRRRPWLFFALGWSWLLWIPLVLFGVSQLALPGILLYALGGLGITGTAAVSCPRDLASTGDRALAARKEEEGNGAG